MFINKVFVEVLNKFNLKTFKDLNLIVILRDFITISFLNSFYLVIVLYAVYYVDLSKQYQVSFRIRYKDRVYLDRYFLLVIRSAAKGVGLTVLITFSVDNNEIKFREEFYLTDLSFIKFLIYRERYEILIVYIHLNLVSSVTQIILLFLEYFDNYYQLLIVNLVVKLQSIKFLREEYYQIQLTIIVSLAQLPSDYIVGGIGFDLERLRRIGYTQHQFVCNPLL